MPFTGSQISNVDGVEYFFRKWISELRSLAETASPPNRRRHSQVTHAMPLYVSPASEHDAFRIAAIHIAAFGTNPMLVAQFPTAATRKNLQFCIATKAVADIQDPNIAVLVVRDDGDSTNEVISFAKWSLPILDGEPYVEAPWSWPQGTDFEAVDQWTRVVENAKERVVGTEACYRLTFIGTDPAHERRGAASLSIQWGLQQCVHDNLPAYLESTVDARPLYEKHGFLAAEEISMPLERVDGKPLLYEEVCFIHRNGAATGK